ncbi:TatD family hydrolase [Escherichia coli]
MCLLIAAAGAGKASGEGGGGGGDQSESVGDNPQFERQQWLLDEQLKLAKRCDLPVILLHGAHTTNWRCILNATIYRALAWSGFSGSLQQAERFVQLGYKIGVGGALAIHAPVNPRCHRKISAGIVVAGNRHAGYAAQRLWGCLTANTLRGCLTCFASYVLEPEDEIAQVLLNNTYAVFSVLWVLFTLFS